MIYTYLLLALTVISAVATLVVRLKTGGVKYFVLKCFSSALFSVLAVVACYENDVPKLLSTFVTAGLIFGFLGDAILGGKEFNTDPSQKMTFLTTGIIGFLFGHIFYIVAFVCSIHPDYLVFTIPAILAVCAGVAFKLLKYKNNIALILLLVAYAYLESLMCYSAGFMMSANAGNVGFIILFVGSVFFCVSDSVLSYVYFGPNKDHKKTLVFIELSTYYIAQILIATSLFFI